MARIERRHVASSPGRSSILSLTLCLAIAGPAGAQPAGLSPSTHAGSAASSQVDTGDAMDEHGSGSYPKFSFDTLVNAEVAGLAAQHAPGRGPGGSLRLDSRAIYNFSDSLLLDGLFQFKPRAPRPASDPNAGLFVNQGAGREEGGKLKELYLRWGDYRFGKFVQNFGRAYLLLPGPYAADFIEETEEGYEPSEMVGAEWLHVFDREDAGWRQLTVSAFMVDRSVLHRSYPYDEGRIHLHDGGLGNTRLPKSVMVTWDVMNQPVGHWAQLTWQASVIRWGRPADAQRGERWATLGADLVVPLRDSLASTLQGRYSQVRFYVEATRRDNFKGVVGRSRDYLSASADYLDGRWVFDITTTQRWTRDSVLPLQKDAIYTTTIGYKLAEQSQLSFSVAQETVADRRGVYIGLRFTKTLTNCSRCMLGGSAY